MKILLTGGGTGGHVFPAVAIAEKIYEKYPAAEILFIGRAGGNENRAITEKKIPLMELEVRGIERRLTLNNIKSLVLAIQALGKAKKIIREFAPDAVIGTGGYVCWPVLRAAQLLGIKTLIHESNVYPGLVTRLSSNHCDAVLLNHGETKRYLKKSANCFVVGNPLRKSFSEMTKDKARRAIGINENEVLIVSFGGSGGAKILNDFSIKLMNNYSRKSPNIRHIHAAGKKYYDALSKAEKTNKKGGSKILPYIDNMPTVLTAADIVICRAGAITLSEIAAAKSPAILIPSPNVTDKHQCKNAHHLASCGAAIMIEEKDLTQEILFEKVKMLAENESERKKLSKCIQRFAISDSAERIFNILTDLIKK